MKLGALSLLTKVKTQDGVHTGWNLAAWHWHNSVTWSWLFGWHRRNSLCKIGFYKWGANIPLVGDFYFKRQRPLWRLNES